MKLDQNLSVRAGVLAALAAVGGTPILLGGNAVMAQEADEEIVVTGSRIRRDEFTSTAPIQVITSESATLEGLIDAGDILQGASIASGSVQFNNRFGGYVIEGGTGVRPVSLRGLGAQRSLVLVNGHRSGPAGVRGQVSGFDLNVIPDSIVQRYEILKDGASSIYGSDAVAGVVNIITRTSVDAPELTIDFTAPSESGGESYSISGATGFNFNRGNVVLAGQVQERKAIRLQDRDYLSCQEDLITDAAGNRIDREDRSILAGTPNAQCFNLYANTFIDAIFGDRYIPSPDGVSAGPVAGYRPRENGTYATGQAFYEDQLFFEQANRETIQNETTRYSLYAASDFELDMLGGVNWRTEGLFTRRETTSEGWRQFFPVIGSADIPVLADFGLPTNAYAYANDPSYANAFGDTLAQPVIPYPSNGSANVDYYSLATTFDGDFGGKLSGWAWTLDAVFSQSTGEYGGNSIVASRSGDIDFDDDPPQFDYLSPTILSGNYGQDFIDAIGAQTRGETVYEQYIVSGVMTGDIATLPAGDVALAVGLEYRDYSIDDQPDALSQSGDLWSQSSALVTQGDDNVSELFAEIEIPVLAGKRGVEELSFNVSARAFDYDSYGSDSVWKLGGNWQVIPALRFRATQGTSYRAPALYELFLGNQTGFLGQAAIDPCIDWGNSSNENLRTNCAAAGIPSDYNGAASSALVTSGGGAGFLKAENSDATTFGVIITPAVGNVSIAVDYFKIEVKDEVSQLGAGSILGGCYAAPVFPNTFCDLFTRNPGTNPMDPEAFGIETVNDSFINVNNQVTEGWDLTVRYEKEFNFGTLLIESQGTYTLVDRVNLFDPSLASGFDTDDFNETIGDPKFTANTRLSITRGDWTYSWFMNYIGNMDNSPYDNEVFTYFGFPDARRDITTPAVRYYDASVRWEGPRMTVIGGINNVLDEDPPGVSEGQTPRYGNIPAFASQYDILGRSAFVSLSTSF